MTCFPIRGAAMAMIQWWMTGRHRVRAALLVGFVLSCLVYLDVPRRTWWSRGPVHVDDRLDNRQRLRRLRRRLRLPDCRPLAFTTDPSIPVTALASFPGSGNTWVRHLLQQATGVFTGSVYRDEVLRRFGFPGEGVTNRSVSVIKTHESSGREKARFARAVLLIRNPFDTIAAEFNREFGGHIGHAPVHKFQNEYEWMDHVSGMAVRWLQFNMDWLNSTCPLHIVHYEQLQTNISAELGRLGRFLGYDIPPHVMECVLINKEGNFHRERRRLGFELYDTNMEAILSQFERTMRLGELLASDRQQQLSNRKHSRTCGNL